ncbi:MAG: hypothetical protein Q8Q14_12565, partial [Gemmatimonadales bacterium]|nr:hypothetical protein [Gemmatimonadales bacterium]
DVAAVTTRVTDVCSAAGITPSQITVTGPNPADPNRRVTVTVSADFNVLTGTILESFNGTIPLRATSVMRHESI